MGTLSNASKVMKRMVRSMSKEESRPILRCVQLKEGNAVSTDSYRLTVERNCWDGDELLIPSDLARAIAKSKAKSAEIKQLGRQIDVTLSDGTQLIDKRVEGTFPKWEGMIPEGCNTLVEIERDKLLAHVRELVKNKANTLELTVSKGDFIVNHTWFKSAYVEGGDLTIGFNPVYFRDALLSTESKTVQIAMIGPLKPAIVTDKEHTEVLLMPVRLDTKKRGKGMKQAPKSPEPKIDQKIETLKGERVCITGTLDGMARSEAFTRLKLQGGIPSEKFTRKVTLLVVGRNAGKTKKEQVDKAIENGQEVKIIDGSTFVEALMRKEPTVAKKEKTAFNPCQGWVVYGTTKDGKTGWVSFSTHKTNKGAEGWLARTAMDCQSTELASIGSIFVSGAKEMDSCQAEVKASLKETCDKVVTWVGGKDRKGGLASTWERKPQVTTDARKQPAVTSCDDAGKRQAAEHPAPKQEAHPAKEQDAAIEISLDTMKKWCSERGNMVATQKREGCCIWIEGETKPFQAELKELGFRWGRSRKGWYFDPKRAA